MATDLAADFLESVGRHAGEGCSTLDLMKRLESPSFPPDTMKEMEHIMLADKQRKHIRRGDALIADITKLGDVEEARNKLRPVFIPDKPLRRVLRRCKLVGEDADKKIITSLVRPLSPTGESLCSVATSSDTSSRTTGRNTAKRMGKLKGHHPVTTSTPLLKPNPDQAPPPTKSNDDIHLDALKAARSHLEDDLMQVTRKLYRKYERKVFPGIHAKANTYQTLHKKWSEPDLTDADKYHAYMDGRFATRNDLEYFKKSADPRDDTNNFHRIHRQHTKYGDSLAFAKHSLRDTF
ncbi:hypothetical protein DYB25_001316 [Aphanomyces astaci]|uniref:Uncharacterized protein n=2 Tax=Aphanomyces astaci TaxID=112090 RepID=A0A397B887_APHAT|nr:hypothetical protein DYB25_001316 [Aphanomyces astaci]